MTTDHQRRILSLSTEQSGAKITTRLNATNETLQSTVTIDKAKGDQNDTKNRERGSIAALRSRIDNLDAMVSRIAATAEQVVQVLQGSKVGTGALSSEQSSKTDQNEAVRPAEEAIATASESKDGGATSSTGAMETSSTKYESEAVRPAEAATAAASREQ